MTEYNLSHKIKNLDGKQLEVRAANESREMTLGLCIVEVLLDPCPRLNGHKMLRRFELAKMVHDAEPLGPGMAPEIALSSEDVQLIMTCADVGEWAFPLVVGRLHEMLELGLAAPPHVPEKASPVLDVAS